MWNENYYEKFPKNLLSFWFRQKKFAIFAWKVYHKYEKLPELPFHENFSNKVADLSFNYFRAIDINWKHTTWAIIVHCYNSINWNWLDRMNCSFRQPVWKEQCVIVIEMSRLNCLLGTLFLLSLSYTRRVMESVLMIISGPTWVSGLWKTYF